ncbi:MAG: tripartite tricarboxylate transporter substrate binding protein [Betaproteobacteria bacterium]|nr:MAG: tripartite tricarboxylate transporter substrate binding protein [Betaproteobacteria bacterium]
MLKLPGACLRALSLALLVAAATPTSAQEQSYPNKPIRFVVPYPPGGSTDPMARLAGAKLAERWGVSVVVDNRPGGNTIIGTDAVAKAPKDGYTILLASSALLTTPSLIRHLPYNVLKDFTGVATIAISRFVLVVPPTNPANNLQEFIAHLKARPGKLSYATSGIGTNTHLSAVQFNQMLGTTMNHIPYKGSGTLQADLMAGRVDLSFQVPISVISHIRAGKLKPLAISGDTRAAALAEVPTFAEAGMPAYKTGGWFGIVMPTGAPRHAIDKMSKEMASVLTAPEVKEYLVKQASEPLISTPEQTTERIKSDVARYAQIIKAAGIKTEQ